MPGFGPLFPEVPATTLNELLDGYIWQNSYISTPFQRYFRASGAYNPFGGGAAMQFPHLYAGAQGGAIYPGQDVTVNRVQMLTAGLFQPKLYTKFILVEEFSLSVLNRGPEAKVKILEAYLEQMMEGIDFQIEGDMFRHGQAAGNGVSDNRLASINGISECLNDGVTPSWDGNVFPVYSGQTRNGAIGASLNSTSDLAWRCKRKSGSPELPGAAQDLHAADWPSDPGLHIVYRLLGHRFCIPAPAAVRDLERPQHQLVRHQVRGFDNLLGRHCSFVLAEADHRQLVHDCRRNSTGAGSDSDWPVCSDRGHAWQPEHQSVPKSRVYLDGNRITDGWVEHYRGRGAAVLAGRRRVGVSAGGCRRLQLLHDGSDSLPAESDPVHPVPAAQLEFL